MPGPGAIMGRWLVIKIRDDVTPKIKEFWNNVKLRISHYLNEKKMTLKKIHVKDSV